MRWLSKAIKILVISVLLIFLWDLIPAAERILDSQLRVDDGRNNNENLHTGINNDSDEEDAKLTETEISGETEKSIEESQLFRAGDTEEFTSEKRKITNKSREYFMTLEELYSYQNISLKDKLTGIAIARKINQGDVEKIRGMASNGITYSEMDEIHKILKKNLSTQDVTKLNEMLSRNKKLYADGKLDK